ncbi:MAG: histidine kinase [Methylobacillus sp.]|nr:histidine kinase [Methylobacillus sp.]
MIRLVHLLWGIVLAMATVTAAGAGEASCAAHVTRIEAALAGASGALPAEAAWVPVTLPDNWEARWPGQGGTVWYRIHWQPACPAASGKALALLAESIVMAGEVHLNGKLLWRDASLREPLSRSWNMPRYWLLPPAMLHEDGNTLLFRVVGVAGQMPGLGRIHLGEAGQLQQQFDQLWWRNRTLFVANLAISAVLGVIIFCAWLGNRRQSEYGWYALMALCWVLFAANTLATTPWPFAHSVMAAKANAMALTLYVACFCMFTWRFGRQRLPRAEQALWAASALLIIAIACTPAAMLKHALTAGYLIPTAVFCINCLQFAVHAMRSRNPENLILAAALLLFCSVALYDCLLVFQVIQEGRALTPFSSIAAMLCMSGVLGLRHARNMRRIERFNEALEQGIDQARAELALRLKREHELVLDNTRLQERLKISHDLHDGLGGSLVRMMAVVEQAPAPLKNQQFLSMLKLLRDDLRQTIDHGSSSGIKVPGTPGEWIAPLRHRFMQLFDDHGIVATWTVPAQWQSPPSALQCLALTRLVEEALVNVLKHSRATRVQVHMWYPGPGELMLRIEDNGIGFDVTAVRRAGISIGMRSMHARIAAVGGSLKVQSEPGCTVLAATFQR